MATFVRYVPGRCKSFQQRDLLHTPEAPLLDRCLPLVTTWTPRAEQPPTDRHRFELNNQRLAGLRLTFFGNNRREAPQFATLLRRIQNEYREMPGLKLTEAQARRLWALDGGTCSFVLTTLLERRFLKRTASGTYVRAFD